MITGAIVGSIEPKELHIRRGERFKCLSQKFYALPQIRRQKRRGLAKDPFDAELDQAKTVDLGGESQPNRASK